MNNCVYSTVFFFKVLVLMREEIKDEDDDINQSSEDLRS